ncbi:MAG: hypothetical protein JWO35_375 [Candidatus Saccharibacteria bacterium]|nr:hypothetical protein [Candidatus Saccharibacteria bacterium]
MLILTIRTDKPEAELGLYEDDKQLTYLHWQAHRELAETIHQQMRDILMSQQKELREVQALAVYEGPGSFTGLRIGVSVANALANSLQVPIVARTGDNWMAQCIAAIQGGENTSIVIPEYGALPNITTPRK